MTDPVTFRYRAFISYSHVDTAWAKWLHRGLEAFRIDKDLVGRETERGPVPRTLRPVFRDRDDFTAGHSLSDQTLAALDASQALIVICSPASAKSAYVKEEVRLFKSRHPDRPVIPLIVDGKPGAPDLECFPPSLKLKPDGDDKITDKPVELLAADAREESDGKSLALAKVIAGLLGVSSDDIFRRAERDRRRRQRNWIAGLSAIAVLLVGLAVWAEINRREAVAQRAEAERNFSLAIQGANSLVFDIAQALRDQEGMRTETVRKILGTAEDVIGKLVATSEGNPELLRLQSVMLNGFAETYESQGDTTRQGEAARKALAIADRLAKSDPDNLEWQHDVSVSSSEVGDLLMAQGNFGEALKAYTRSRTIVDRLARAEPNNAVWQRSLSASYIKVGDVLVAQRNRAEGLKAYRRSLAIVDRLANADPNNTEWQRDLSVSYSKIGNILRARGSLDEALDSYRGILTIFSRLAKADPGNAAWQYDLGISYERIGDILLAQGDLTGALQSYETKRTIISRLVKADPGNANWERGLSVAHHKIGDVLRAEGNLDEALKAYRDSLAIFDRLAETNPSNAGWMTDLAVSYGKTGDAWMAQGNFFEALESYRSGRAIFDRLVKSDQENVGWQRDLATSHGRVAEVLAKHGESEQALSEYRNARDITARLQEQSPNNFTYQNDLAWYDAEIAKLKEGRSAAPAAAELETKQPPQAAQ